MISGVLDRPVGPAEFAVRFGLEPADVEWLIVSYGQGTAASQVRKELQALGCTPREAERLLPLIARATAALAA
jgi:hypothetical protein